MYKDFVYDGYCCILRRTKREIEICADQKSFFVYVYTGLDIENCQLDVN